MEGSRVSSLNALSSVSTGATESTVREIPWIGDPRTRIYPSISYYHAILWAKYCETHLLYNVDSQELIKFPLSTNFGEGGSYLHRTSLLCLGGDPPSPHVYTLSLTSMQLTPLPDLSIPRKAPGSVQFNDTVCMNSEGQFDQVIP